MAKVENWIWLQNLQPFVEVLAWLSGYELADGEWDAIRYGVEESDSDANPPRWYKFAYHGKHKVILDIGHDKGTNVVQFKLDVSDAIAAKVELALDLMNQYALVSLDTRV